MLLIVLILQLVFVVIYAITKNKVYLLATIGLLSVAIVVWCMIAINSRIFSYEILNVMAIATTGMLLYAATLFDKLLESIIVGSKTETIEDPEKEPTN